MSERLDAIILVVKLRNGGFESSIECPVSADRKSMDEFVASWLKLMELGLAIAKEPRP